MQAVSIASSVEVSGDCWVVCTTERGPINFLIWDVVVTARGGRCSKCREQGGLGVTLLRHERKLAGRMGEVDGEKGWLESWRESWFVIPRPSTSVCLVWCVVRGCWFNGFYRSSCCSWIDRNRQDARTATMKQPSPGREIPSRERGFPKTNAPKTTDP